MISPSKVGDEPGDWLTTFALLTECTDAKFCNTTNQVVMMMVVMMMVLMMVLMLTECTDAKFCNTTNQGDFPFSLQMWALCQETNKF